MRWRHLILVVVLPLGAEQRAQIAGIVQDSSEAVMPDASITAVNEDTGITRSTHSDANGAYVIAALPAGTYKITVRKPGFQTVARLNVHLAPAVDSRLDFILLVGSVREVVTIQGTPAVINSEDASVSTLADRKLLDTLPLNGRGVLSLIELAPGVVTTPATLGEAGQFSVNGQRPNANYFTVDGVSANTGVSGSAMPAQFSGGTLPSMTAFGSTQTLSPTEDIQEVKVQTSTFTAEFGRAPGANVGITTRSGTNELHGSTFYLGRNDALNANDWFANASGLPRASASLNNWGAAIGGPLRPDRTFFFVDYQGLRFLAPYTWRFAVPSIASRQAAPVLLQPVLAAFPILNGTSLGGGLSEFVTNASRPSQLDLGSLRIDHALTARVSVFGRYQRAPSSTESGFAQVDHSHFFSDSFTFGASALASPNMISDTRVNFARTSVASRWVASGAGGAVPADLSTLFPQSQLSGTVLYGFAVGGVGQILSGDGSRSHQNQWNATETLSWNRGSYALRVGIDYNRLSPARNVPASTIAGSYPSLLDLLQNHAMTITTGHADQASSLVETAGVFAQNTWRVTPRLSTSYGVRWEWTPAPEYRVGGTSSAATQTVVSTTGNLIAIWPTRYTQFAPRVGAAYRIAPRIVLRAGWGLFYDAEFGVATDPINAFPYNRWQYATAAPGLPLAPGAGTSSGYVYAPDLKLPYAREWNVSAEYAMRDTDALAVSYVGSAGRHLLRREATLAQDQLALTPTATNNGRANYNALQVQYRRKLASGVQGLGFYSWSHSIDNGSWDSGIYRPQVTAHDDRGPSTFDVRHNFSVGLAWQVPKFPSGGLTQSIARSWTLSAFVFARSGFPIDVLSSENLLGLGFDDYRRPDLLPGVPIWLEDATAPGGRRLNKAAFSTDSTTAQGNLGRDAIRGFGLGQVDLAVGREIAVREDSALDIRLEAYNATNHAQFGDPLRFLNGPLFGQSVSMLNLMLGSGTPHSGIAPAFQVGGARVLQLTLRLRF